MKEHPMGKTPQTYIWSGTPTGEGNPPWPLYPADAVPAKTLHLDMSALEHVGIGRLGATVPLAYDRTAKLMVALDMAERRIIRLERALRLSGIPLDHIELEL